MSKGLTGYQRTGLTWVTISDGKDFTVSIKGLIDTSYLSGASWGVRRTTWANLFYLEE